MRRESRMVAAVFAVFIISVAGLREWIHGDADDEPETAEMSSFGPPPDVEVAPEGPAQAVDGAELVEAHEGYDDWRAHPETGRQPGPDEKWIAVDVELALAPGSAFAFEDVAVLVNGRVESREPVVRPLESDSDHRRVLLGFIVPRRTRAVALGYGTARLTGTPIALDGFEAEEPR